MVLTTKEVVINIEFDIFFCKVDLSVFSDISIYAISDDINDWIFLITSAEDEVKDINA